MARGALAELGREGPGWWLGHSLLGPWPVLWVPSSPSHAGLVCRAPSTGVSPALSLALPQNFLYKCVGTTLGAASSKDVVRKLLQELLETARYQEEAEREVPAPAPPLGSPRPTAGQWRSLSSLRHRASEGACAHVCAAHRGSHVVWACVCRVCAPPTLRLHIPALVSKPHAPPQGLACCFGICAISHLDDTLAQLEDFVRSDVSRKSMGIFNIFKVQQQPGWGGGREGHPGLRMPCRLWGWVPEMHSVSASSWDRQPSVGSLPAGDKGHAALPCPTYLLLVLCPLVAGRGSFLAKAHFRRGWTICLPTCALVPPCGVSWGLSLLQNLRVGLAVQV